MGILEIRRKMSGKVTNTKVVLKLGPTRMGFCNFKKNEIMKNTYPSLSVAIEDLQKKGYDTDFNLIDEGIESKHQKKSWKAEEIEVEDAMRFEGMTNPDDSSVLYVINTKDGVKGLLVDAYGAYGGQISQEMIEKLRITH